MATQQEQLVAVRGLVAAFLERIVDLSNGAPPPGPNAANGYFREGVVRDGRLNDLLQRPPEIVDGEALLVLNDFTTFAADLRNGFHPDNYGTGWFGNISLFVQALQRYGGVVLNIVNDIFAALGGNSDQARDNARARVGTDIQNLVNAVAGKGAVLGGTHANGWIQVGVREAGGRGVAAFDDGLTKVRDAAATQTLAVLRELAVKLRDTGDRTMNPWLDAQWQIDFQAKVQAAAGALRVA